MWVFIVLDDEASKSMKSKLAYLISFQGCQETRNKQNGIKERISNSRKECKQTQNMQSTT